MEMEGRPALMRPQAQEPPEAGRDKDPPLETSEGVQPDHALILDLWLPGLREDKFLLF